MSTDEYVPDEQEFIDSWACAHVTPQDMTAEEAKDVARAFLARVRRDAARDAEARIKAVQHLIDQADEMGEWAITCTRLQWAIDGSSPQPGA